MTDLTKKVERRTMEPVQAVRRKVIVSLLPGDVIAFREEGRQHTFTAPISRVFTTVVGWNADAEAAAKRQQKAIDRAIRRI